jgi:hypothetical protein
MNATVTALGAVAWLFVLLLFVGLAQAAARGDTVLRRALAVERERRTVAGGGRSGVGPAAPAGEQLREFLVCVR